MIFTFGIFFLQVAADAADGPAGAHAADEVRDLPFRILPDFRAGGAVMRLGIHGVFVLVGIKRIGNFLAQFFRDRVIAARIVRLDGRGADDHFRAEGLEQVHFFLRLLVGDGEDHLVAAHGRDQRQAHAGVARSAFDDRAAGLEQALALGFVDHGDADAVLHRAARIQVVGFDVHFGAKSLVMRFSRTSGVRPMVSRMLLHFIVSFRPQKRSGKCTTRSRLVPPLLRANAMAPRPGPQSMITR